MNYEEEIDIEEILHPHQNKTEDEDIDEDPEEFGILKVKSIAIKMKKRVILTIKKRRKKWER